MNGLLDIICGSKKKEIESVVEGIGEPFRVVDTEFNVLWDNRAMRDFTGSEEGQKLKCFDQLSGAACHSESCTLKRVLAGEEEIKAEVDKISATGAVVPMALTATPYKDSNGKVIGVIEFFRDISEMMNLLEGIGEPFRLIDK
jgi:PAS domain S-box-containing protein